MGIDGWLVLDIALGIVVGDALRVMVKDTQIWWKERRADSSKAADSSEDWNFLWDNLSESGKKEVRKVVEDDELRRRAQELNLWHDLWYAASEETKEQLRHRWKAAKIPPRVSG
ncbi:MAG: hypothetical protein WB680_18080 [Candidatus Acidiferrales bacterium]